MARLVAGLGSLRPSPTPQPSLANIFAARVDAIILDDKTYPEEFKDFGEWSSIGNIFFTSILTPNPNPKFTTNNLAKPLFPNNKIYPLINEIVYILALPNNTIQENLGGISYYYFQPISIWGSNHHNAIPDPIFGESIPQSQQRDYEQIEGGLVRRVTDGGTEIDLGETFKERLDIKPLQPYEGDIIYEGRWGQSIRFGSTVKGANILNPWSRTGENGDPITILRNAQYSENNDPWVPQVEDTNKEGSSIYMTSTQAIPIEISSKSYKSYSTPPTSPDKFAGEQVIINSGRLLFNSKTDSILFSSKDTINLNSVNSINIDTPKTVIQSNEIYLGDKNATEPVILGDKFLNDIGKLCDALIQLCSPASLPITVVSPGVPNPQIAAYATQVSIQAQTIKNSISSYKSKVSKTK